MKRYLLLTFLILLLTSTTSNGAEVIKEPSDLETLFNESFYESPTSLVMPKIEEVKGYSNGEEIKSNSSQVEVIEGSNIKPVRGMPLFKKTRIKITNKLREKRYKETMEEIERAKQVQEKEEAEEIKKLNKELNIKIDEPETKENISEEASNDENNKTLELEGGVKEHVTSNDVMLDAEKIDYNDKTMDITATGSPILVFPPQNVTVKADKMVYNNASNILKAYGKVEVIRDGKSAFGDYLQINMNEEDAFMDNTRAKASMLTVNAKRSEMKDDKLILHDGKMSSDESYILNFHTRMIGGNYFNNMLIDDDDKSTLSEETGQTAVHIKAKDIYVNAKRDHDVITLKKARIHYGDVNLLNWPSITIHTNKKHQFF